MNKLYNSTQTTVFCGIDVSAATLAVVVQQQDRPVLQREFANSAAGHREQTGWLHQRKAEVRVAMESTGIYSLDLALALDQADRVEVAVLNPKLVHRFAQTLRRSKTDAADAQMLAEYAQRMPFAPWCAPSRTHLPLRSPSRHIDGLTEQQTREFNRLHAAQAMAAMAPCMVQDLKRSLASIQRRIQRLRRDAMALVRADETLNRRFQLLTGIPGIAHL